jgi:mRNA-degrading endonuclease RelE of RelBE toxin-antitoxin system
VFQIIFNDISAAEMSKLPKELQLEVLSEFHVMPEDFKSQQSEKFGVLNREGKTYYRFRAKDYRIYFEKEESKIIIHRVLNKNTLKDFLFRSKLPLGEDEALQQDPNFWRLLDEVNSKKE